MIRFEIKKIFSKITNKIGLLILAVAIFVVSILAIKSVYYVDEEGNELYGIEGVHELKKIKNQWSGYITDEMLSRMIRENDKINNSKEYISKDYHQNNKAYAKKQGFDDIRDMVSRAFSSFQEYDYYRADSITEEEVGNFYRKRAQGLEEWLNEEDVKNEFNELEKKYLIGQYDKIPTPFYYEYSEGWNKLLEYAPMIIMLFLLITSFFVSGIFSNEYQLKTDAIFFSTKFGRNKAVRAKVVAGFLIITILYWIVISIYSMIVLGVLGTDGGKCLIQTGLGGWKSFYNITFFQEYLLTILGGYLGSLFILTLSMWISIKVHSAVLAVTIPFILLFIPSFLIGKPILSKVIGLLPDQLLQLNMSIRYFNVYQIGGKVIGAVPILILIYLILYIILIPTLYKGYQKEQVK